MELRVSFFTFLCGDNMSSYEEYIMNILRKENISFIREKTFKDLKKGKFRFDFYIKEKNIIIEVDGEYHFKEIRGRRAFLKQCEHDRQKNSYCLCHNINLYRIPYWDLGKIEQFSDITQDKYKVKNKWHNDNLKKG